MYPRRQGSGLDELCSGAGRRRETGSVPLKVGDWAGWAWWSGVGRRAMWLCEAGRAGDLAGMGMEKDQGGHSCY